MHEPLIGDCSLCNGFKNEILNEDIDDLTFLLENDAIYERSIFFYTQGNKIRRPKVQNKIDFTWSHTDSFTSVYCWKESSFSISFKKD